MNPAGIIALIEATPRRPADGVGVTVRLCWNAVTRANFFGEQWYPGLDTLPSFETNLGFDGVNFGQGATPTVGGMVIGIDPVTAPYASLVWKNAPLTLRIAPRPSAGDPADADFAVAWTGRADTQSEKDGLLTIAALDTGLALRKPVQPVLFGSSGSDLLDGPDAVDKAGQPVPVGWGVLSAVPALLVDKTYNIWVLLGVPATSITAIEDGGAPLTLGVARASLAELRSAAPAAGAADYCLNADGLTLVRPWTAPTYPLIADLIAGPTTPARIAASIVASRSAIAFTAGTVAAFDALTSAPCQLYVADGKTVAEALDLIFPALGAYWRVGSAGTIDLGRWARAPAATRDLANARFGPVTRLSIAMPTGRRTLGYATNNRVLGTNEIAQSLTADNALAVGGVSAATIAAEIAAATAAAAAATVELANISSDGVLTPSEKAIAIRDADVIAAEQATLDSQADAFGVTDEKTAYDNAVGALAVYLASLVAPVPWNDLTGNTAIDGPTFRARFAAALEARAVLLVAISAAAAVWSNQSGAGLPQANADVTALAQVYVDVPVTAAFAADYLGNLTVPLSPVSVRVAKGGVSIKLNDTTTYAITVNGGLAATVDDTNGSPTKGDITPTAFTANTASIDVVVTVAGIAQPKQTIAYSKTLAAPPASGGAGAKSASDSALANLSAATFTPISTVLTVTLAAGETLYGTASLDYDVSGTTSGGRSVMAKWQYSPAGAGAWTDFGAAIGGTVASSSHYSSGELIDGVSGHVDANQNKAGLAAATYDVQLVAALNTTGRTVSFAGAATIQAHG